MPDSEHWSPNGGDPSLNELRRIDRYLDSLGAEQHPYSTDSAEAELAFLLADWRDGVREPAVTTPVTARDAVAALQKGLHRKESRGSLAIVGSVAAALLCLGGFGTAVYGAGPGDALYGLHTAMFGGERVSRDDQVMLAAQTEMQQVQQLIDTGQWQQAQDKLQALSPTVQSIDTPEHKQQLIKQWNALTYKVVEQNPAATLPPAGEPLPVMPSSPLTLLPVPVVVSPSSSTSTTTTSASDTTTPSGTESSTTSPTSGTTTTSPSAGSSTTETSSSESPTASSTSTSASSPASSTSASASSTAPTSATGTGTASPTASASTSAPAPSSEPVVTNPATASPTAVPSPTQSAQITTPVQTPVPAQTTVTVAPTVSTPTAATPVPTTKEAPPSTHERSPQQAVTTTTEAPSGHGQH
ncbi:hypothetical protein FZI85_14225 [Mycobacterium sp. CBMA293]|uniref:anti-sigma-D factor RsdA n=1 Tax=unclassified Mycolicibacterium TaxID=2636767 RepID=UPI0012DEEC68|nr:MULTISPECIES: anti-sigma-D factor RsdA [unclassified Mycolicibacterium]MUL48179.1 hypothetical protein [Mycolicibacterium sp. CBMA 360]MUL57652.1 hypothetical protein [Mycolicibacterium sp. CBMA 335]MUL70692.1 hypothetical protein [Mycolicibacterium sp. CBMA 311]MUL92740.1 hypothetical protein [Mycolicibacterium sp. CBMA 230]MUM08245.1 hypothetical protein [Mycolicibacterium sp. CBMA 213]